MEDHRMQRVAEAIRYIKTYKLFSWISRFTSHAQREYRKEISEKTWLLKFDGLMNCSQDLISKLIPVIVFFLFGCFGHPVTLPEVMLTSVMLSKAKSRFA